MILSEALSRFFNHVDAAKTKNYLKLKLELKLQKSAV